MRSMIVAGVAGLYFALVGSACHKWAPVSPPVHVFRAQLAQYPEDRDVLRLQIGPDSLIQGQVIAVTDDSVALSMGDSEIASVAIRDVDSVEVQQEDSAMTIVAVVGVTGLAVGIAALIIVATTSGVVVD